MDVTGWNSTSVLRFALFLLIVDLEVPFALKLSTPYRESRLWRESSSSGGSATEKPQVAKSLSQVEDWKRQVLRLIPPRDNCDAPYSIIRIIVIILNNLQPCRCLCETAVLRVIMSAKDCVSRYFNSINYISFWYIHRIGHNTTTNWCIEIGNHDREWKS